VLRGQKPSPWAPVGFMDTSKDLAMLLILYGTSVTALDAFRAVDDPVSNSLSSTWRRWLNGRTARSNGSLRASPIPASGWLYPTNSDLRRCRTFDRLGRRPEKNKEVGEPANDGRDAPIPALHHLTIGAANELPTPELLAIHELVVDRP
jgi:hypothetical protein